MLLALSEFCRMGGDQMSREELVKKIRAAKEELKTAGTIHRKDLQKHIRRMQKELRIYDEYHGGDNH